MFEVGRQLSVAVRICWSDLLRGQVVESRQNSRERQCSTGDFLAEGGQRGVEACPGENGDGTCHQPVHLGETLRAWGWESRPWGA